MQSFLDLPAFQIGALVVIFIWLTILTVYTLLTIQKSQGPKRRRPQPDITNQTQDLTQLKQHIETLSKQTSFALTKIGIVRFNPFQDQGGDQSFAIALLDSQAHGFVLSSLHARTGTRTYVKLIVGGKSLRNELSAEEEKAVAQALEQKKYS